MISIFFRPEKSLELQGVGRHDTSIFGFGPTNIAQNKGAAPSQWHVTSRQQQQQKIIIRETRGSKQSV